MTRVNLRNPIRGNPPKGPKTHLRHPHTGEHFCNRPGEISIPIRLRLMSPEEFKNACAVCVLAYYRFKHETDPTLVDRLVSEFKKMRGVR